MIDLPTESLDTKGASQKLMVSTSALAKWRSEGTGPKFFKIGGTVRYLKVDLDEWIDSQYRLGAQG